MERLPPIAELPVGDNEDLCNGGLPTISWPFRIFMTGLSTNVIDFGACEASIGVPFGVANNNSNG